MYPNNFSNMLSLLSLLVYIVCVNVSVIDLWISRLELDSLVSVASYIHVECDHVLMNLYIGNV